MQQYGPCDPFPCFALSIEGVPPTVFEGILPEARKKIEGALSKALYSSIDGDLPEQEGKEIENLVDPLIKRFNEETGRPDGRQTDWVLRRKAALIFNNKEVLTFDIVSEEYFGGAHSIAEHTIKSFLKSDGSVVGFDTLVAPYSRSIFQSVLEVEFRRAFEIPPGSSFEDAGFTVKNGTSLPIPENIGVVDGGLLLHYNPYEIAPYSKGSFALKVPLEPLEPLLRGGDLPGSAKKLFETTP